jgi:hypothetical protein
MVELIVLVWLLVAFFAVVGFRRGWTKEIIALSGIVLGLFALFQFDGLLRQTLFGDLPPGQVYYIQAALFITVVFFAYQTRALGEGRPRRGEGRDETQTQILGGIVGGINGYLVSGTLWYFLDIANYPTAPAVVPPPAGTLSAATVGNLPLYVLTQGGQNGDLLSLLVVILFIVVLVLI